MLGENLRHLTRNAGSVSQLCRDLGINRTQFNRYLSGESFPRPDVLYRICSFFGVDARILLEPVSTIRSPEAGLLAQEEFRDFVGAAARNLSETDFPSGFYQFSRASFMEEGRFVLGLLIVYRRDGYTFLRGLEARDAIRAQGLPIDHATREFRGVILPQSGGVTILVSRRGAVTSTLNFLTRVPSFDNNYWVGFTARTVAESSTGRRAARQVYQYLGQDTRAILNAARSSGITTAEALPDFHRRALQIGVPFE